MSDTARNESIEHYRSFLELNLRLAHFQGRRLELLYIGMSKHFSITLTSTVFVCSVAKSRGGVGRRETRKKTYL